MSYGVSYSTFLKKKTLEICLSSQNMVLFVKCNVNYVLHFCYNLALVSEKYIKISIFFKASTELGRNVLTGNIFCEKKLVYFILLKKYMRTIMLFSI